MNWSRITWALLLCLAVKSASAINFYVGSGETFCYKERFELDETVRGEYAASDTDEKAAMVLDLNIKNENGKVIFSKDNMDHGKFTFTTSSYKEYHQSSGGRGDDDDDYYQYELWSDISYEICVTARSVHVSQKGKRKVRINLHVGDQISSHEDIATGESISLLENNLDILKKSLNEVNENLRKAQEREKVLLFYNDKTHQKILVWCGLSVAVLIVVSVAQIFYSRNYLKKKKII